MKYYAGPWIWDESNPSQPHYRPPAGTVAVVDLRTLPLQSVANHAQGTGSGFFCGPDSLAMPLEYTLLATGDLRESQIGSQQRSAWESVFGVALPQSTDRLIDALSYTLSDGSDPDGVSAPRPIVPGVGPPVGEATINLAGHSVVWRRSLSVATGIGKHAKALRDLLKKDLQHIADADPTDKHWRRCLAATKQKYGQKWDDPDEAWLLTEKLRNKGKGRNKDGSIGRSRAEPHATTYTESWPSAGAPTSSQDQAWSYLDSIYNGFTVSSNQLTSTGDNSQKFMMITTALSSSDVYAKLKYKSFTGTPEGQTFGGIIRKSSDTSVRTFYFLESGCDSTTLYRPYLKKDVSNTITTLTFGSQYTLSADQFHRIRCDGSTLEFYEDATSRVSTTDTAISSGTYCGINYSSNGSRTPVTDDYECGDLAAAASSMSRSPLSIPMAFMAQ